MVRVEADPHSYGLGTKKFIYEDEGDIPGINSNTASRIELLEDDEGHLPLAILPLATALGILGGDVVVDLVERT